MDDMIKLFNYLIAIMCIISCNEMGYSSMNQPRRDMDVIKNEIFNGNVDSYHELKIIYLDYPPQDFLFWSLLMANKYDYPQAYLEVFHAIVLEHVWDLVTWPQTALFPPVFRFFQSRSPTMFLQKPKN